MHKLAEVGKKRNKNLTLIKREVPEVIVDDLSDQELEDLEFAIRTEKAYREYHRGQFHTMSAKKFLEELEKW